MTGLHCDYYELTMAQGYWVQRNNPQVVFDMFIRANPFGGGYTVCAGLSSFFDALEQFHFSDTDIEYLQEQKIFRPDFLQYLRGFKFSGTIYAVHEGDIVFPHEPLMRVHGNLIEAQIIESLALNIINFQSLVATKTARIYHAAQQGVILEFGMRRAQGLDGALSASRAAYIGGATATSHGAAAKRYGIPVSGTMAHSWVQAHSNESVAFKKYSDIYTENVYFLIDTYDSLGSGIDAAIRVGKNLRKNGRTFGVRLDSGDIEYISKRIRARLDAAGLPDATIAVSNELNEEIIEHLIAAQSPIDAWGVGTHLITGAPDAALGGVYKLCAKYNGEQFDPVMKVANDPHKSTNPGIKQVYRFFDTNGSPQVDLVAQHDESIDPHHERMFYHPLMDYRKFRYTPEGTMEGLLHKWIDNGQRVREMPQLVDIRARCLEALLKLDQTYQRRINPHIYRVSISEGLRGVKEAIIRQGFSAE